MESEGLRDGRDSANPYAVTWSAISELHVTVVHSFVVILATRLRDSIFTFTPEANVHGSVPYAVYSRLRQKMIRLC